MVGVDGRGGIVTLVGGRKVFEKDGRYWWWWLHKDSEIKSIDKVGISVWLLEGGKKEDWADIGRVYK